jgi:Flp pilus assembly protein TadD
MDDLVGAESPLLKYLSLDATNVPARVLLGCVRLRQERLNDALSEFRRASALDPADALSLCMIGFVMEKRGRLEDAARYYGQALKADPKDRLASELLAGLRLEE